MAHDHFATVATAASYSPLSAPDYIQTAFYDDAKVVGSGAIYRKVSTEPSHAGKFSITLQNASVAWYEIADPEPHIAQLGARMDGATDDAAAVLAAHGIGRPVRLGPGIIRCASMLEITGNTPRWRGSGGANDTGRNLSGVTVLLGDHSDAGVIKLNLPGGAPQMQSLTMRDMDIQGKVSSPPANQHGIIAANTGELSKCHLENVHGTNLTGKLWAWDPAENNYSQTIIWTNVHMHSTGGGMGLTQAPANGANYLACTYLKLDNVSCRFLNGAATGPYIWDFRAVREISAPNFLNEGTCPSGFTSVMGFATDGNNVFENVWEELSGSPPPYLAYFEADSEGKFFGTTRSVTRFRNVTTERKFGFAADSTAYVVVSGAGHFEQTSWDEIVDMEGDGAHILFEDLETNYTLLPLPMHLVGQVELRSYGWVANTPLWRGIAEQAVSRIASWRPSMGEPTSWGNPYLDISATPDSSAIEADDESTHIQVWRATKALPDGPTDISITMRLPYDWFEVTLAYDAETSPFTVGSVLTGGTSGAEARIVSVQDDGASGTLKLKMRTATNFQDNEAITDAAGGSATVDGAPTKRGPRCTLVVRYRLDWDTSTGVTFRWAGAGKDVARGRYAIDREWQTLVVHRPFGPLSLGGMEGYEGLMRNGSTLDTSDVIVRLAAVDLYLGRSYQEPLDLSYAP